jgi:uncharacterized coiled-coil protein SlyX
VRGEGRVQPLGFALARTDAALRDLETKKAHIEATLAELRLINAEVRQRLSAR